MIIGLLYTNTVQNRKGQTENNSKVIWQNVLNVLIIHGFGTPDELMI